MTTVTVPSPPPASPPPPLSPGGRTAIRVVVIIAAAVLVIGTVASLGALAWGVSNFRVVTDSVALPATLRSIAVDTGSVPVAVHITSDPNARRAARRHEDGELGARGFGSAVGERRRPLGAGEHRRRGVTDPGLGPGSEITLVLPPQQARRMTVTTQQETGVVFAQADLDQLITRTGDGGVELRGSARRIDITAEHANIRSRDPIAVSDAFRVTTGAGDVDVEFSSVPKTIDAQTGNGDITVALPAPGPFVVNATTGQQWGTTVVRVPQTRDSGDAASVVTVRSDTGDVTVEELN